MKRLRAIQTLCLSLMIAAAANAQVAPPRGAGPRRAPRMRARTGPEPRRQFATPTLLLAPVDWRFEAMPLPPRFAPKVKWTGFEEIRFAPGVFDNSSPNYFSYVIALSVNGTSAIDAAGIKDFLETYFRGLLPRVGQRKGLTVNASQIAAEIAPAQTKPKTNARCQGTVTIIDTFTDGRKTTLNVEADVLPQEALKKTHVLLLLSPRARDSKIWKTLRGIRDKTIASSAMATAIPAATSRIPVAANYFPPHTGDWERITPEEAGWNAKHLQAAMDLAGKAKSTGVVIILGGKILTERYWDLSKEKGTLKFSMRKHGKSPEGYPIEDVASVQKSVTSFLVGVAQGKGLIDFEAPVSKYLGEGWSRASKAQEAKIAVYHLLSMSSGLNEALEYQAEAGTAWRYNTVAYSQTHKLLEKATNKDIQTITREWLTTPAGMKDSRWTPRGAGGGAASTNRVGFSTTARDLARFGLVMLRKGHWEERDLLQNPGYLEQAVAPSQEMNKAYGLLWWLNGHPKPRQRQAPARLLPTAPKDLFAAQGALGRKLYVVPSLDLVITRIGDNAPQDFPDRFWEKLLLARGE